MTAKRKKAIVAGAGGIVGRGLVEYLSSLEDWEIVGLSRKIPDYKSRAAFVSVDLLDVEDCRAKLSTITDATHVFYAALLQKPTEVEQVETNGGMLRNLIDAIEQVAKELQHISLMEGAKAYGCHLGPFKSPARETDPRHMPPNFYFTQEDDLRAKQRGKSWTYSVIRPDLVCGPGVGHPMNLTMVLAVYGTICKELGLGFRFPGKPGAYTALFDATDTGLLARATVWAATEPRCANEVFNITNGDCFRWQYLWPKLGEFFGLEVGTPQPMPLSQMMADKGPLWDRIVKNYGLKTHAYNQVVSWEFGEFVLSLEYDVIVSVTKARQFGFHEVVDTEEMFLRMFRQFREQRYIP